MSKIGAFLKVSALACALATASQAFADSTFTVPVNYTVKLVDGQTSDFNYSRFNRKISFKPGRHQIVLLFEGSFGNSRDSRLIQAANPIVIDINDMPDNVDYTFQYEMPRDEQTAEKFSRSQRISLVNNATKAKLNSDEASYYILTSDSGFAILRDYRDDLASVGRLYAPAPVLAELEKSRGQSKVNADGVLTVEAHSGARPSYSNQVTDPDAPKVVQSYSKGTPADATYNQLVDLYNSADDATKLKFVKYIMSH